MINPIIPYFPSTIPILVTSPKKSPVDHRKNRSELKDLGASEEEVLTELRRQRQERLKAPEESLLRAQRIQKLHGG